MVSGRFPSGHQSFTSYRRTDDRARSLQTTNVISIITKKEEEPKAETNGLSNDEY